MILRLHLFRDAEAGGENFRHVVSRHVQGRGHDVIRPLVRELQDVLAEIGFHGFQMMMLQALVEMNLLGSHRLGFDDHLRFAFLRKSKHEVGDFLAVAAEHNLAAVRHDIGFQLIEVVIQILDGVLLDLVGNRTQILIIGQSVGRHRRCAMIDQTACG